MIQVNVDHNSGLQEDIFLGNTDTNNTYTFVILPTPNVAGIMKLENGALTDFGRGFAGSETAPSQTDPHVHRIFA